MIKKEEKYLKNLISEVKYFDLFIKDINYMTPKGKKDLLAIIQNIDSWLSKGNNLIFGINVSLNSAMNYDKDIDYDNYNPFKSDVNKNYTYYFIENAIYRISSLWDVLAQICNDFFECNKNIGDINADDFLKSEFIKRCNKYNELAEQTNKDITKYINEEISRDFSDEKHFWKGNHKYLRKIRNELIHRNDPHSITVLNSNKSNPKFELPQIPMYELKIMTEDYIECYRFIKQLLNKIKIKMKQESFYKEVLKNYVDW